MTKIAGGTNMKTFIGIGFGIGLCIFGLTVPVSAHPPITVYVNQQEVQFLDQAPVIVEDRTLVPMRRIFEALDAQVSWSEPIQTITSVRGDDTVELVIGDDKVYKNGEVVGTMDVPAQIMQDRTMVPIRAVAAAFDASVTWDGVTYTIRIQTDEQEENGNVTEQIYAVDGTQIATVSLTYAALQEDTAGAKQINDEVYEQIQQKSTGLITQYTQMAQTAYTAAQQDGEPFLPFYAICAYTVSGTSENYVSVVLEERSFQGGQEQKTISAQTYNRQTGSVVSLSDLVTDSPSQTQALIQQGFMLLVDAQPDRFYTDAEARLQEHLDEVVYYLEGNHLVFALNSGILADASAGMVAFMVPYAG